MGVLGFEPRTSALSELRSNQLSYTPDVCSQPGSTGGVGKGIDRSVPLQASGHEFF